MVVLEVLLFPGEPTKGLKKKAPAGAEADIAKANYDKIWKKTPKTKGIYLLLSSQSYETSNAEVKGNSLYTKHLIEGLNGVQPTVEGERYSGSIDENGNVTPESLHEYIYYKVADITDQVPDIKVDRASPSVPAAYHEKVATQDESLRLFLLLKEGMIKEFNEIRGQKVNKFIDLHSVNFEGANLEGVDLHKANLEGINLKGARLNGANIIEANLRGANLERAYINRADLRGANLEGAVLKMAIVQANLGGVDLRGADLGTNLAEADFKGARFYKIKVIMNVQGHPKPGVRFSNLLKADLRQSKNLPISKKEAKSRGAII